MVELIYQTDDVTLVKGDFFSEEVQEFVRPLSPKLILTDPPYGIASAGKETRVGGVLYSTAQAWGDAFKDSWTEEEYDAMILRFLTVSHGLLAVGDSLCTFIDDAYAGVLIRLGRAVGFHHKKNVHFVKKNPVPKVRTSMYASAVELAVWLVRGHVGSKPPAPSVFNYVKPLPMEKGEGTASYLDRWSTNVKFHTIGSGKVSKHPTEKYQSMWRVLINHHTSPGDLVLDPFAGSFSCAVACRALGRRYIGVDLQDAWSGNVVELLTKKA